MNDWIQTYTGRKFYPLNPSADDISILDIAHALSMKCRYNGHCERFYSVAEHSFHVSHQVPQEHAMWGLLHDAAEAYLPDVPRPIKPHLPGFRELEASIMVCVVRCFAPYLGGLSEPESVKRADTAILADEMAQLMGEPPAPWNLPEPPLGVTLHCLTPEHAENAFLRRFAELAYP